MGFWRWFLGIPYTREEKELRVKALKEYLNSKGSTSANTYYEAGLELAELEYELEMKIKGEEAP